MKKSLFSAFFVLVSASGLLDAAQGRGGQQPDRAECEYKFNFLNMVARQLERSQRLLEEQNQSLQGQPEQPVVQPQASEPVQRPAQAQAAVVQAALQDALHRQLRRVPQVLPVEQADERFDRQRQLHSNVSVEAIRMRIIQQDKQDDFKNKLDLSDLSQVVVFPTSMKVVISLRAAYRMFSKPDFDGRDPATRELIPAEFQTLVLDVGAFKGLDDGRGDVPRRGILGYPVGAPAGATMLRYNDAESGRIFVRWTGGESNVFFNNVFQAEFGSAQELRTAIKRWPCRGGFLWLCKMLDALGEILGEALNKRLAAEVSSESTERAVCLLLEAREVINEELQRYGYNQNQEN